LNHSGNGISPFDKLRVSGKWHFYVRCHPPTSDPQYDPQKVQHVMDAYNTLTIRAGGNRLAISGRLNIT